PTIARNDDLQQITRALRTDQTQPPIQYEPRAQSTDCRSEDAFPLTHHFSHLDRIARAAKKEKLHRFVGFVEEQVDQAADDSNTAGDQQMKGFFAESKLLS